MEQSVNLNDPDGQCPRCWASAFRVARRIYKIYKKTNKLTPKALKEAGLDEIVDIAGDLYTIFSGDAGLFDKIGAAADLLIGTDFNSKGNQAASRILGRTGDAQKAKGGVYVLKDKDGTVVRTGRTNDLERRKREHERGEETGGLDFEVVYKTDDYAEQRGLEGLLYEQYKATAKQENGGLNKRRPIRPGNPREEEYLNAAVDYLERNGYE